MWNSIAEESYDYQNGGANNRRIQRTTVWHNQSYNETYSYDHLDRLTSASAGSIFSRSYSYDVYGNITSVLGSGGPHPSYSLSYNGNRVNGWSYDASGNLLSDGANSYSYNAVGQITSSSNGNSSYGYDGDSKRVKKTENGVTTYYIRSENLGMVLGEVNSSGTVTRSYLPGIGGAMAVSSGGSVYWLHRDIRGSGRAMTSKTGAVQWRAEYDPFGQVLSEMATVANSKKFTGYERDNNSSATGLDYSMFRYHSSYWGRFQTPDPYDGSYDLSNPQSFNRYAYVQNDPINFTDPLGLFLPGPANDPGPTLNPYGCYDLYVDGIYMGKIGACGGSPAPAVDIGGDVGGGPEPAPQKPKFEPGKVYKCSRRTNIIGVYSFVNSVAKHFWLRTDQKEAGLGALGGGVPGQNAPPDSPYVSQTAIVDHSGQSEQPNATCEEVKEADPAVVNRLLEIGKPMGRFTATNNCFTFVNQIIWKARGNDKRNPWEDAIKYNPYPFP